MLIPILFTTLASVTPGPEPVAQGEAAPEGKQRILVYTFTATAALEARARSTTEAVLVHLGKKDGLTAISQAELEILLEHEKDKHALEGCAGREECLAQVSSAAKADKVISGRLGRWGDGGALLTMELVDVESATLERGESCTTDDLDELEACTLGAVDRLLGRGSDKLSTFSLAVPEAGLRVAVIDLEAYGVSRELTGNLTQLLALELKRLDRVTVVTPAEIALLISYEYDKLVAARSTDLSRLAEIGGALGVDYLVTGGVGRLDDTHVVHLKLVRVSPPEVVQRVSESFRGPERDLTQAIRFAAFDLVGAHHDGEGGFSVTANADEAALAVDGGEAVILPLAEPWMGFGSGKHALSVTAEGYVPLHREAYVQVGEVTELAVELLPITEWYETWWFWTAAGVVVAGTTGGILWATLPPKGAPGAVGF